MTTATCLSDDEVSAYVAGELGSDDERDLLDHLDACASCRVRVSALAASTPMLDSAATLRDRPEARGDVAGAVAGARVGRFKLSRLLGRGGMGEVWAATDLELGRQVALKLIRGRPEASGGVDTLRMRREAQALARLNHPNVVQIYDFGTEGERVFCAMELVDGVTLHEHLTTRRAWRDVLAIARAVARGLIGVHAAGLVHRDVKPDNILIAGDGRTLVSDFGLARPFEVEVEVGTPSAEVDSHGDPALTVPGAVLGTPLYMSPEQIAGVLADARSDQFSYAVTIHEALFGKRPFAGETLDQLARAIAGSPQRPADLRGVPSGVWRALARSLAADPAARWPSMAALLAAIERAAGVPRRRKLAVAGSLAVAAAVCTGFLVLQSTSEDPETRIARAWNPIRAAQLAIAFGASGARYADERAAAAIHAFDAYRADWAEQRRSTHFDEELKPRQLACFDRLADVLGQVVAVYVQPGPGDVHNASTIADRLESPAQCRDLKMLAARSVPPSSFAGVLAQASLNQFQATYLSGRYADAIRVLQAAVAQVEASGEPALVARAHYDLGQARRLGGHSAQGEPLILRALQEAAAAGDHYLVATCLLSLLEITAKEGDRVAEARGMAPAVRAAVAQAGDDPQQQAKLEDDLGLLAAQASQLVEARDHYAAALDRYTQALGPSHALVIYAETRLAAILTELGQLDEANARLTHAAATVRAGGHARHPALAEIETDLSRLAELRGEWPTAERHARAALEVERAIEDADGRTPDVDSDMAGEHVDIAETLRGQHRYDEARAELAQARAIYARLGSAVIEVVPADLVLVDIENAQHHDAAALATAQATLDRVGAAGGSPAYEFTLLRDIADVTARSSPARALPYYDRAYQLYVQLTPERAKADTEALRKITEVALAAKQPQAALAWFERMPQAAAQLADLRGKLEHAR